MGRPLKLHSITALATGQKSTAEPKLAQIHRLSKEPSLFVGQNRICVPVTDGEAEIDESKNPIQNQFQLLRDFRDVWLDFGNIRVTQEIANTRAKAHVYLDGQVFLEDVPVTALVALQTHLERLFTYAKELPVRDQSQNWTWDKDNGVYKSETKKTERAVTAREWITVPNSGVPEKGIAPQVKDVEKRTVTGVWENTMVTTLLSREEKQALVQRVEAMLSAVKVARQEANDSVEAPINEHICGSIAHVLFGPIQNFTP